MAIFNREDSRTTLPQLENLLAGLYDTFYPVGSYYETSDTKFNPNKAWGGRWILEVEGQVHVSAGENYVIDGALTNENDDGASTVTLNTNQIPSHDHGSSGGGGTFTGGEHTHSIHGRSVYAVGSNYTALCKSGGDTYTDAALSKGHTHTLPNHTHTSVGGNQAHNNMQPYIVVNRWHRIA